MKTFQYPFQKTKSATPQENYCLLAIYEMDYAVNSINLNGYILQYDLRVNQRTITDLQIVLEFRYNVFTKLKISIMVMEDTFLFKDIFSVRTFSRY